MGRLSVSERNELWDLWEAGESQRSISRRLGRSPSTVRTRLVSAGWRRPSRLVEWCSLRLSLGEREKISRGLARDESLRSIAWGSHLQRCLVSSRPMAVTSSIAPMWRIGRR